jgi:hypothetical protein
LLTRLFPNKSIYYSLAYTYVKIGAIPLEGLWRHLNGKALANRPTLWMEELMNQSQNSALSYRHDGGIRLNNEFWDGFRGSYLS